MLLPPTPKFRRRSRPKPPASPSSPPANVLSATLDEVGEIVTMVFDRPLTLVGSWPYGPLDDGSVQFNDSNPVSVDQPGGAPDTLQFVAAQILSPGAQWNLNAQPQWLTTPVALPQTGTLA
jgi:hypothetical protein